MKLNKCLKIISIVLECSFIGSVIIYIYNYFVVSKKYEVIPIEVKTRLNTFIVIAISSLILFLLLKYVIYILNKTNNEIKEEQLQLDLKEEKEKKYRNLEAPVTERVFIYKNEYEVPKERQIICENCGNIVDKNAFICVKCGCLLKEMPKERIVERVVRQEVKKERKNITDEQLMNMLVNVGLIIAIIIFVILIINLAIERGIIG